MERVLPQLVKKIFIRSPKFHDRAHNNPLLISFLREINAVHIFPNDFVKILSDIILASMLLPFKWAPSLSKALCTSSL
jgi:hypothetical protein